MLGHHAISEAPIGALAASGDTPPPGPDFQVTGWLAARFGIPSMPVDVSGWMAARFGRPSLVFAPDVDSLLGARFGVPVIPHNIRVYVSGWRAARFGYPVALLSRPAYRRVRLRVYRLRGARFGTPTT